MDAKTNVPPLSDTEKALLCLTHQWTSEGYPDRQGYSCPIDPLPEYLIEGVLHHLGYVESDVRLAIASLCRLKLMEMERTRQRVPEWHRWCFPNGAFMEVDEDHSDDDLPASRFVLVNGDPVVELCSIWEDRCPHCGETFNPDTEGVKIYVPGRFNVTTGVRCPVCKKNIDWSELGIAAYNVTDEGFAVARSLLFGGFRVFPMAPKAPDRLNGLREFLGRQTDSRNKSEIKLKTPAKMLLTAVDAVDHVADISGDDGPLRRFIRETVEQQFPKCFHISDRKVWFVPQNLHLSPFVPERTNAASL